MTQEPEDPAVQLAQALFQACRDGQAESVMAVVEQGAPPNMQDAGGNTMIILGDAGADPDLGTPTARDAATMFNRTVDFSPAHR